MLDLVNGSLLLIVSSFERNLVVGRGDRIAEMEKPQPGWLGLRENVIKLVSRQEETLIPIMLKRSS